MLHSTREYQMIRNMNTRRSLYIICLLMLSVVSNQLDAQTGVKPAEQQKDNTRHALIHQIGYDVRPGYVDPTNPAFEVCFPVQQRFLFGEVVSSCLSGHRCFA